jgi:hypothetical protein
VLCAGFIDRNFERIAEFATYYYDQVFPIDTKRLSQVVADLCPDPEKEVVAVGNSTADVLSELSAERAVTPQAVAVLADSRVRERRIVQAASLLRSETGRYFVDDVIVTGNTMRTAMDAGQFQDGDEVVAGMAFDSRTARRRVGTPIKSAIEYRQEGGGIPSVNSFSTFVEKPDMAFDYAQRKGISKTIMEILMDIYQREDES